MCEKRKKNKKKTGNNTIIPGLGRVCLSVHCLSVYLYYYYCQKQKEKKMNKLSQLLKSHISGTLKVISLKCGIWSTEVGGSVHSKNRLVSPCRQHRGAKIAFSFVFPVNILTGVARRLLGPHDTLLRVS